MKKKCNDCGVEKDIAEFSIIKNRNKTKTVYRKPYCKACVIQKFEAWKLKNRDKFLAYQAKWHRQQYKKNKV